MIRALLWLTIMSNPAAYAGFVPLFIDGDSVIKFSETCVYETQDKLNAAPGGLPCGDLALAWEERKRLFRDIHEDVVVAGTKKYSMSGSTLSVTQNSKRELIFQVNEKEVLRFKDPGGVADPIGTAFWHKNQWVIEYLGKNVMVNGKEITKEKGYDGAFFYRIISGKPFYFFYNGGKVWISYAGVRQRTTYDDVAHRLCCSKGTFNPDWSTEAVSFFGRRGDKWFHVIAMPRETGEKDK